LNGLIYHKHTVLD